MLAWSIALHGVVAGETEGFETDEFFPSQRDCALQPMVDPLDLPWVDSCKRMNHDVVSPVGVITRATEFGGTALLFDGV